MSIFGPLAIVDFRDIKNEQWDKKNNLLLNMGCKGRSQNSSVKAVDGR